MVLHKKALSQVDWAISLSIFLIYLALFFIFVKPLIVPSRNIDSLMENLEDKFLDDTQTTVERVRIFVTQKVNSQFDFIIANFTYPTWNASNMAASTDYFAVDVGKVFFLLNTTQTKKAALFHPLVKRRTNPLPALIADVDHAEFESFRALFDDELLQRMVFRGATRVSGVQYRVDGGTLSPGGTFARTDVYAKYKVRDEINHSTYVPASNSRVYVFMLSDDSKDHNMTFSANIFNFTRYFVDQSRRGTVAYSSVQTCEEFTSRFIDFNDGETGIAFFTEPASSMSFCSNLTALTFSFLITVSNTSSSYAIFAHDGDHTAVQNYPITPINGVREQLVGISDANVSNLKLYDYTQLKQRWSFPAERDFNITVLSPVINATFGRTTTKNVDAYGRKKVVSFALDRNLNTPTGTLQFVVW
ncbi:hypothetical protein HZB03_02460 [Candidatus Woesearchaeota archaeon]|nr:hypothetical protein [Candidatus Woesearchaeota archaeon]